MNKNIENFNEFLKSIGVTDVRKLNLETKIQIARVYLHSLGLKMSGKNAHLNFPYYELEDFEPQADVVFLLLGLYDTYKYDIDASGIEWFLYIVKNSDNPMESDTMALRTRDPNGNNQIQILGAQLKYLYRYAKRTYLHIAEKDEVDPTLDSNKKVDFATAGQVSVIQSNGKLIADELKALNVKTINDIKALTKEKAKELCDLIEERKSAKD